MKLHLILLAAVCLAAQTASEEVPRIETIMSRVARNQAKTLDARTGYVYNQSQLLRMIRGNHKIAREERREYVVTPKDRGVTKTLAHFEGKYERRGDYVAYDRPGYHYKDLDLDGELLDEMSREMTNDHKSRDGFGHDLFPLTYHQQLRYAFKLEATGTYEGRKIYRVSFQPHGKANWDDNGAAWKGEALIDAAEFQPVQVTTRLAWKVPLAVKTLLGTNITGLGFTLTYARISDGVWFPVSYGGEFQFRGLFFYERTCTISVKNTDFKRTDVNSTVAYASEK